MTQLDSSDLHIKIDNKTALFAKKIFKDPSGAPLVLIHGSLENGCIFYSKNLKGFAPFMANLGYCVYVIDLRGKGKSSPKISKDIDFDQLRVIKDLEYVYQYIFNEHPGEKQVWASHSWGGVLINCFLLRNPEFINNIHSLVHFATKRSISTFNIQKFFYINLGFNILMSLQAKIIGYVSSHLFGIDSEAKSYHENVKSWVAPSKFIDLTDNYDYAAAAKKYQLPRALYLSGANDHFLGHKSDVQDFIKESHPNAGAEFWYLSKENGYKKDYEHNDILTAKEAREDHFVKVCEWLKTV